MLRPEVPGQRAALQAHFVADQPLQAVGHAGRTARAGVCVGELDHGAALAGLVERREVVADGVDLRGRSRISFGNAGITGR